MKKRSPKNKKNVKNVKNVTKRKKTFVNVEKNVTSVIFLRTDEFEMPIGLGQAGYKVGSNSKVKIAL